MVKHRTKKERPGKRGDMPHTIAKRYKVPRAVVNEIKLHAPPYGSQGRAIQVATELLIRLPSPVRINGAMDAEVIGMTYKLTPRTVELIEELTEQYGKRGNVLAACSEVLKPPKERKRK
jgi:hypothetical protein